MDDLCMDLLTRKVTRAGKAVTLQAREFKLLEYLMRHPNQVVTRTMLLENVWDYNFDPQTNVSTFTSASCAKRSMRDSRGRCCAPSAMPAIC